MSYLDILKEQFKFEYEFKKKKRIPLPVSMISTA